MLGRRPSVAAPQTHVYLTENEPHHKQPPQITIINAGLVCMTKRPRPHIPPESAPTNSSTKRDTHDAPCTSVEVRHARIILGKPRPSVTTPRTRIYPLGKEPPPQATSNPPPLPTSHSTPDSLMERPRLHNPLESASTNNSSTKLDKHHPLLYVHRSIPTEGMPEQQQNGGHTTACLSTQTQTADFLPRGVTPVQTMYQPRAPSCFQR